MDIHKDQYKKLTAYMIGTFRKMETEILAYRVVIQAVKALNPGYPFDAALNQARCSSAVLEVMSKKYDEYLETLLKAIDQANEDQEISEFLRSWTPQGPIN